MNKLFVSIVCLILAACSTPKLVVDYDQPYLSGKTPTPVTTAPTASQCPNEPNYNPLLTYPYGSNPDKYCKHKEEKKEQPEPQEEIKCASFQWESGVMLARNKEPEVSKCA